MRVHIMLLVCAELCKAAEFLNDGIFFTFHKACQDVAVEIRAKIEEFRPYIPLIQGLRNPGMRNRHWEMLSEEIKMNVKPKANLTFARCLEMKLQDHIESIAKVAEIAGKEYAIEHVRRLFKHIFFAALFYSVARSVDEWFSYGCSSPPEC